jgi:hypothetical protein
MVQTEDEAKTPSMATSAYLDGGANVRRSGCWKTDGCSSLHGFVVFVHETLHSSRIDKREGTADRAKQKHGRLVRVSAGCSRHNSSLGNSFMAE